MSQTTVQLLSDIVSDVKLNAQKELRLADSDSSNYVGFKSPATVGTNIVWTLPSADAGTSGFALVSNGSGALSWAAAGGTVADDSITYAKIQNVTTANRVLGSTSADGEVAEIQIATDMIADDAVTTDKLANSINTAIDTNTAKTSNATHTGDVTGATELTIAEDAVTYAKMQNVTTTDRVLGRDSAGAGVIEEISPADLRTMLNVADGAEANVNADWNSSSGDSQISNKPTLAASATTDTTDASNIDSGTLPIARIADDAVTYAKIQNVSTTDRILGRDSSGAGVIEEITPANLRTMINVADGATVGLPATGGTFTGSVTFEDAINENVFTLSDGATVTLDPDNGTIQVWTLTADDRDASFTGFDDGQSMLLMVADGTAYSIDWPSGTEPTWVGGSAPTLATTGYTCIEIWKVGGTIYASHVGDVA